MAHALLPEVSVREREPIPVEPMRDEYLRESVPMSQTTLPTTPNPAPPDQRSSPETASPGRSGNAYSPRKLAGRVKRRLLTRWNRFKDWLGVRVLRKAQKSRFYSILYYAAFSPAFHWELHATANAIQTYHDRLQSGHRSAILRRNVHRLEKGLLMRPRRSSFAADFIEETVEQYAKRVGDVRDCEEEAELAWATAVLLAYFDSVDDDQEPIARSRPIFEQAVAQRASDRESCRTQVPYLRNISEPPPVDYEALYQLARRRRSNRWFLPKPVPREITEKAVAIATQSPSACNRQPFEFRIFDDPELAPEIASLAPGSRGFSHNVPAVAVLVGRLDSYFSEGDRHLIYIDSSLAAMGFMYGLEAQGLSSCPLNWPDAERLERKMAAKLGLKRYQRAIMLIAFGYPDETGKVAYSQKKSPKELCRYNELA